MTAQPSARTSEMPAARQSAGRVRLRTLVVWRWVAIGGQAAAILAVYVGLGFPLPLGLAFVVVTASALLNVAMSFRYPATKRLSDGEAALYLGYDVVQLAALLYLTGGLSNPFAVLVLVPLTVAATILSLRSTICLAGLALVLITVLALYHEPLPWRGGGLVFEPVYLAGIWVGLALGIIFLGTYAWRVAQEARRMSDALVETHMELAREQKLAALGGLAAAAAHELGTPLGTIAVIAKELETELPADSPLQKDAALLAAEAARCRDILKRLSAESGEPATSPLGPLPLSAVLETAASPCRHGDIEVTVEAADGEQPRVPRLPELVQGLGNLIENAVDFAHSRVRLDADWDQSEVRVEINDDGPGFDQNVLGLLGEPYVSTRREADRMGLGVFIATTLLERTGARVHFANGTKGGARVLVGWPRAVFEAMSLPPGPHE